MFSRMKSLCFPGPSLYSIQDEGSIIKGLWCYYILVIIMLSPCFDLIALHRNNVSLSNVTICPHCIIASMKPVSCQKTLTLCSQHKCLFNAWKIPLTNINPSKKDGIVVWALHFSHWATSKTRLNIGKDLDQLLWTYIVGEVKLPWQNNNET